MALLSNGTQYWGGPVVLFSGLNSVLGGVGTERGNFDKAGRKRNLWAGDADIDPKSSVPVGYLVGGSWSISPKAGGMSSRNSAIASITAQGNGAQGINLSGSVTMTMTVTGSAAAVAAAVGSALMSITVSGSAVAPLNAVGAALMSLSAQADASAVAHLNGSATASIVASAVTGAIGHMIATPIDTQLTADSIAAAVWNSIASAYNTAGSMGEKVNDAGSASNPWTEALPGSYVEGTAGYIVGNILDLIGVRLVEGGLSQDEVSRIMLAALAGKREGLGTATEQYMAQDGTTPRITLAGFDASGNGTPTVDGS
jgi:hypothetical protein